MATAIKLNQPWMVAVWPGMGHVAISAGYYLMAKLGMHILAEFPRTRAVRRRARRGEGRPDPHRPTATEPVLCLD